MKLIGSGIFSWGGHERRSNRYGSFFLSSSTSEGKGKESFSLYPENLPAQGAKVKIQVVVKKTRKSWHLGDAAIKVYPSKPKKGDTFVLGVGSFSLGPSPDRKEATDIVSLIPSDGRDELWFDPRILYQLHLELLKIAGAGQSDPEKGLLLWEFLLPERLPDALNLLKRTGWTRIFLEENEIKMVYNVRTDDTVLRDFYDPKDAEDYLEYLMVGTHP